MHLKLTLILTLFAAMPSLVAAKSVKLNGVEGKVEAEVSRLALVRSYDAKSGSDVKALVHKFYRSLPYAKSESHKLVVRLFDVNTLSGKPFWLGFRSSKGKKSVEVILDYLAKDFFRVSGCDKFTEESSAVASIVGTAPYEYFSMAAQGYSHLIHALTIQYEGGSLNMDRPVYTRHCFVAEDEYLYQQAFFIDPTPYVDPDHSGYFVVISVNSRG